MGEGCWIIRFEAMPIYLSGSLIIINTLNQYQKCFISKEYKKCKY